VTAANVPLYDDARRAEFPPGTTNLEIALTDALNVYHEALQVAADLLAQDGYDTDPDYRQEWQTIREALDG